LATGALRSQLLLPSVTCLVGARNLRQVRAIRDIAYDTQKMMKGELEGIKEKYGESDVIDLLQFVRENEKQSVKPSEELSKKTSE
jgi:hypothetical protein